MSLHPVLSRFVDDLEERPLLELNGLGVSGLWRCATPPDPAVTVLPEALANEQVAIEETGVVSELEVISSPTAGTTLILEGEIVEGGKQNRTFNQTFAVPAGARVRAPASCVEEQRWDHGHKAFGVSPYKTSPRVKSEIRRSIYREFRSRRSRRSDQSRVWAAAKSTLDACDSQSPTQDSLAAYRKHRARLEEESKRFRRVLAEEELVGFRVGYPDGRGALEAFACPSLARRALESLLWGHLLVSEPREGDPARLEPWADQLRTAESSCAAGIGGLGEEVRLCQGQLHGSAFLLNGETLHLSLDWAAH